jgi:hypothetical protein
VIHLGQFTLEAAAAVVVDPCLVFGVGQCREADKKFYTLIESYTPGGVAQCADRTAAAWQKTWDWLSTYAPVTDISLSPAQPDGSNGAYRRPVTVTLSTTDNFHGWIDMGPFEILYSLDGGSTYRSYTAPFLIDSEGVHRISVYSVDSLGNSENVQNLTLTIGG